ncbi:hypothetical protein CFC21_007768 [Triticum aestivum]|uniref:DUF1618 domain-containing protein n=2 Tax=Triticum aestivum TaxID=4565 RepID=A0A9R1DF07_WHEAT|nr:uncharacterized protein LOC123136663 isoform X1 [Triticum aestivum]KAF6990599.1 hypothetical protein CFC21_007768 [Triticum aestivum]
MPLRRRLLGLSGGLRRSLATAATHPPWAMINRTVEVVEAPSADVRLAEPPLVSELCVPERLVKTRGSPDPDGDVVQSLAGGVFAASGDGLLFLSCLDLRSTAPGASRVRLHPSGLDPTHVPSVTRLVCNPLTRELRRLPDSGFDPVGDVLCGLNMGLLTQADRGHGPPDKFAVADLRQGNHMLRFLSETGKWENVALSPCQVPLARRQPVTPDQATLAFGGRLWWIDLSWGAISADPFSDRPELSFVELPRGSVLPAGAQKEAFRRGSLLPDAEGRAWWKQASFSYRRMGVSEGRLRYVEVSHEEPFLLRSFVLDDEGTGWTLEHRVVLNKLWGSTMGLPLQERGSTRIFLIDPLNANVVYLTAHRIAVVAVDMDRQEVIGCYPYRSDLCMPCVLPPWLRSSRIPSAGKKYVEKNKTLADVLVRLQSH